MVTQTHHFDLPGLGKIPWRSAWQTIPVFFLGNPMDRGAGWATTYRVTKSQTQLKRLCMCVRARTHTHTQKLSISPHFPASAPRAPHHCAPRVSSEQLPPGRARAQACPVPHSPSGEFSDLCLHHLLCLNLPVCFERMLFTSMLLLPASPQTCSHKGTSSLMHIPLHCLHFQTTAYTIPAAKNARVWGVGWVGGGGGRLKREGT